MKPQIVYDFDPVHPVLDRRGHPHADRGGRDRDRRHLPVPRLAPLGADSRRHHPPVAHRRLHADAGAGLQPQPADPAGDGAGDRPRGRRRDRRGRERAPPHRGGPDAGPGGADRRARDRGSGDRDDHHAGRRLCADRLPRRPHRLAVSRVRVHPGGRGDHLGHRSHSPSRR